MIIIDGYRSLLDEYVKSIEDNMANVEENKKELSCWNEICDFAEKIRISSNDIPQMIELESLRDIKYWEVVLKLVRAISIMERTRENLDKLIAQRRYVKRFYNEGYDNLNDTHKQYLSNFEFLVDIVMMQRMANDKYKYSADKEYEKFVESIRVFSPDTMLEIGHFENDNRLKGKMAESICQVCRISWEKQYFENLKNRYDRLIKYDKKRDAKNLQKAEKKNILARYWLDDTRRLGQNPEFFDTEFGRVFRNEFDESYQKEIDRFVCSWLM